LQEVFTINLQVSAVGKNNTAAYTCGSFLATHHSPLATQLALFALANIKVCVIICAGYSAGGHLRLLLLATHR